MYVCRTIDLFLYRQGYIPEHLVLIPANLTLLPANLTPKNYPAIPTTLTPLGSRLSHDNILRDSLYSGI